MKMGSDRNFLTIILVVIAITIATFFIVVPWFKADQYYVDLEYHGVIRGVEYRKGNRGVPHILLDSAWRLLTIDEIKIEKFVMMGDSIVKKKGRKIEIYRKINNKYKLVGVY